MATDARLKELEALIEQARKVAMSIGAGKTKQRNAANGRLRSLRLLAARARGTHKPDDWAALVARFSGRCVRCGCTPHSVEKDHILAICHGGSDAIENLQPLCKSCNCAKTRESTNWVVYRDLHGFEDA